MPDGSIVLLVVLILMVILSAYFSATETAFTSLNRIRLKSKADNGDRRAKLVLELSENYDRLLSTILIGNNIVNNVATTLSAVLFIDLLGSGTGPAVSTVVLTVVILIFGEISPKSLAKESPEAFARFSAPILRVLLVILTPLNFIFTQWKKLLGLLFRRKDAEGITDEELMTIVSEAEDQGGLDEDEGQLIRSAIRFDDLEAGDILTPRVDMVALEDTATMDEAAALFAEEGYSRLPIYHENLDDIVGVIHQKDLFSARYHGRADLSALIHPVLHITATAKIDELMRQFQRTKTHMAIVVDEYGGTDGLLTLEDVVEELVGEIWDEHDEEEVFLRKLGPDAYAVDAAMDFDDFAAYFHLKTDSEMVSVSGWVMEQFGRVPEAGDSFTFDGLRVEVTRVENHRIEEIHVEQETPKATA